MATITATSRTATATLPRSSTSSSISTTTKQYRPSSNSDNDLKACLEILARLAPRVKPDLPPLPPSNANNNVTITGTSTTTQKRKKGDEADSKDDSIVKRSRTRRSSSPEDTKKSSNGSIAKKLSSSSKRPSPDAVVDKSTITSKQGATIPSTNATSHKRSTSTVSLSDLKARNNKLKTNGEDSEAALSSSSIRKTTKATLNGPTAKNGSGQPSDLSISTNNKQASISPTLPSPAPTLQSRSQQPLSAPSPESIALNGITSNGNNGNNITWTRERFKRIAAICREKGRALKHSGDKRMREYSSPSPSISAPSAGSSGQPANRHITPILALFEQVDAVILYAYAFWCEDQAAGCVRGRQSSAAGNVSTPNMLSNSTNSDSSATLGASTSSTSSSTSSSAPHQPTSSSNTTNEAGHSTSNTSPTNNGNNGSHSYTWKSGCIAENWKSIFGLVAFVRGRAEKLMCTPVHPSLVNPSRGGNRKMEGVHRAMEIIVAWMNMLEALILQHLTTNSSRQLNSQASRLLSSNNNLTSTCSNSSTTGLSPAAEGGGGPGAGNGAGGDSESIISNTSSSSIQETNNFLQSFLKLQSDLEKIHTLWPASQDILLHPDQSALPSSASRSDANRSDVNGASSRQEEDILNLVLRKGRMAYDYEPTKLDDIVMPNLPKDGDEDIFNEDDEDNDDSMDAEGEIDPTVPQTSNTTTTTHLAPSNTLTNKGIRRSSSTGPKSPEDLFKDEENYFRFSWPVVIHHRNAIAHTTSFGRALIFEMANRLGVDYTPPDILPSRRS